MFDFKLRFIVTGDMVSVCRLSADSPLPAWALDGEFFSVTKTTDELSIVCNEGQAPEHIKKENGFRLIKVDAKLDFSLVGILAKISSLLSQRGISIFVVSTYDTDYVMVKDKDLRGAIDAFVEAGHEVVDKTRKNKTKFGIWPVSPDEFPQCVDVIRTAFGTVARDLNLTRENAPTNPAFIELRHLEKMVEKGIRMFGLFAESRIVGFVALEKQSDSVYCMERLAVLPDFRHRGYGRELVKFIADTVKRESGNRIKIGVINENSVLKAWYEGFGFFETELKVFDHLPFTVCYMELAV